VVDRLSETVASRVNVLVGFSLLVFIFLIMGLVKPKIFKIHCEGDQETVVLLMASQSIARKFRKYMIVRTIASIVTGVAVAFWFTHGLELAAAQSYLRA
jgi:hypothetical protein